MKTKTATKEQCILFGEVYVAIRNCTPRFKYFPLTPLPKCKPTGWPEIQLGVYSEAKSGPALIDSGVCFKEEDNIHRIYFSINGDWIICTHRGQKTFLNILSESETRQLIAPCMTPQFADELMEFLKREGREAEKKLRRVVEDLSMIPHACEPVFKIIQATKGAFNKR